jgi:phosphoadenosine phosphosulfate reductase
MMFDGTPLDEWTLFTMREVARETDGPLRGGKPWHVAYSGGKDSTVLLDLVKRSGVPFETYYAFVPIDPPELRRFIFDQMKLPQNRLHVRWPKDSFISAARKRGIMPLRNRRWCCEIFKEHATATGGAILTGIRWAESAMRRKQPMRKGCTRKGGGVFFHPIIGWTNSDVWTYIREQNLPYCQLYDEGWKRLGCVLCPMTRNTKQEIARWPFAEKVWRQICQATFDRRRDSGQRLFTTVEQQWAWWLSRDAKASSEDDCPLFDGTLE